MKHKVWSSLEGRFLRWAGAVERNSSLNKYIYCEGALLLVSIYFSLALTRNYCFELTGFLCHLRKVDINKEKWLKNYQK